LADAADLRGFFCADGSRSVVAAVFNRQGRSLNLHFFDEGEGFVYAVFGNGT
jgi:hypothetical protein